MFNAPRPSISSAVVLVLLSPAVLAAACAPTVSPESTSVSVPTPSPVTVTPSVGSSPNPAPSCPPPILSEAACAAVMVSVKVNGLCCTYGSPCAAPPGEQFSDDKCTHSNAIPPKKPPSGSGGAPGPKPLATRGQPCDLDSTPCAPGLKCFVEPMLPTRNGVCR